MSTSTLPDKALRDEYLKKVREFHSPNISKFELPDLKIVPKLFFTPASKTDKSEKFMSFFFSEVSEGKDLYIENCNADNSPIDPQRRLYKWRFNPFFNDASEGYEKTDRLDKNGKPHYLIPIDELVLVISYPEGKPVLASHDKVLLDTKNVQVQTPVKKYTLDSPVNGMTVREVATVILQELINSK